MTERSGKKPTTGIALEALPRDRLERMADAAAELARCEEALSKSGENVVAELLRSAGSFYEWEHYPKGDVYDPDSHAQYYYHAHAAGERPQEHGHFHTFLRQQGMPKDVRPALRPVAKKGRRPDGPQEALSHIVGIGIDPYGRARSLFTTNRWVTGETWYRAEDVVRMIDRFDVELARPSWLVNRWVSAMIALYSPEIEALLHARDRAIEEHRRAHPDVDVFEDRSLEVTSEIAIDPARQRAAVEAAIGGT